MITKFFHRLFHYHCEECVQEELEAKVCHSCETLKQQLAWVNQQNALLLSKITKEPEETPVDPAPPVQLGKKLPWTAMRSTLEQADREKAMVMRKHSESIKDLEKELGVENAT